MTTPQWALERIQKTKKEKSAILDLNGMFFGHLTEIPDAVFELSQLTVLDLSDNQLTSLPESISRLKKLTSLGLRKNKLTSLPEFTKTLQNLTLLDLSDNQ